jgi:3-methyladenine DNA glycosylase AlkD
LAPFADATRAEQERAYLKSDRTFLGVSVPDSRKVVRQYLRDRAIDAHDDVVALALEWWDGPVFEGRRAAVEALAARVGLLGAADLPLIESLVRDGETWAIVDGLAGDAAGRIIEACVGTDERSRPDLPAEVGELLDRWSVDASFWVRRLSLLCQLRSLKSGAPDVDPPLWLRFCRYADSMLDEREFFIRKAIGWVLREVSQQRPALVRAWVDPRLDRMSGTTRSEALKYL